MVPTTGLEPALNVLEGRRLSIRLRGLFKSFSQPFLYILYNNFKKKSRFYFKKVSIYHQLRLGWDLNPLHFQLQSFLKLPCDFQLHNILHFGRKCGIRTRSLVRPRHAVYQIDVTPDCLEAFPAGRFTNPLAKCRLTVSRSVLTPKTTRLCWFIISFTLKRC